MGFADGATILSPLCKLARIDEKTGKCSKNKGVIYIQDPKKEREDAFPEDFTFDVVLVDVTSRLCSIGMTCLNGAEVRDTLCSMAKEYFDVHKARVVGFFFDDRRHASSAKHTERAKRVEQRSSRCEPYENTVELRQPQDHGRPAEFADQVLHEIPLADYEFALDCALPKDFARVLSTPELLAKFSRFVAHQIATAVVVPDKCRLIVAGEKIVEIPGEMEDGAVPDDNPCTFTVLGKARDTEPGKLKRLCTRSPASGVGEAEGQCFHRWNQELISLRRNKGNTVALTALVSANDTDAIACALLNVRHLYSASKQRICGKLFVDYSHTRSVRRFVDCVRLWRRLKESMAEPRQIGPSLRHDVETLMLVAMLSGNDYCARIPRLGSSTLFKLFEEALLYPARNAKRHALKIVDSAKGEWLVDESVVGAYMARVFGAQKFCEDALKFAQKEHKGDAESDKRFADKAVLEKTLKICKAYRTAAKTVGAPPWLVEFRAQREFIDVAHRCSTAFDHKKRTDEAAAQKPVRGSPLVPSYKEVRAHIRRAYYSLHYFAHIHTPAATIDALLASKSGHSLFGHRHGEFVDEVQIGDTVSGQHLQPFLAEVREREVHDKKRKKPPENPVAKTAKTDAN